MEGFGMTPQEAAATRVPVISSALVPFVVEYLLGKDIKEVPYTLGEGKLKMGEGAIVVSPDDVDGFASALDILLSDKSLRQKMSEAALSDHDTVLHLAAHGAKFLKRKRCQTGFQWRRRMSSQLTHETLQTILQAENIEKVTAAELERLVKGEQGIAQFAPDGICQTDPRNGDRIVYNSARARRPHDNRKSQVGEDAKEKKACLICEGKTTGVIDVADLSEGFTFINKNLFPIFYPEKTASDEISGEVHGLSANGYHFLQWTSSYHDRDWHNMPLEDRIIVLERLAALEKQIAGSA